MVGWGGDGKVGELGTGQGRGRAWWGGDGRGWMGKGGDEGEGGGE
jgi:hypothetical protein